MAAIELRDGTGDADRAKVNSSNRLETFSITESRIADISNRFGDSFILTSDFVGLSTTGAFNGMMYIRNNNPDKIIFIDKRNIECPQAHW